MAGGRKIICSFMKFFHFSSVEVVNILPQFLADTVLCDAFGIPARSNSF